MNVEHELARYIRYLRHTRGKSDNTIRADAFRVRRFLRHVGTATPTEDDVYRFLDVLYAENRGKNTIRNYVYAIREYFRMKGVEFDINPPKQVMRTIPDVPDIEEVKRLLAACTNFRDLAIMRVLLATGMRAGELVALNRDDYEPENQWIRVRDTKNREDRVAVLTDEARDALETYLRHRLDDNPAMFVSNDVHAKRLARSTLHRLIRRIGEKAGVRVYPHLLRHTCATHMLDEVKRRGQAQSTKAQIQNAFQWEAYFTAISYLHVFPYYILQFFRGFEYYKTLHLLEALCIFHIFLSYSELEGLSTR